ncbi:MAG: Mut7-C ubiquitin/RNAse domain-containing protein [Bacteroidales bacterium]|nr:Mut7-C ubiquitin/RNAse domain-containing protein [Bacteroidales bacterium]MBN2764533.1 Mut7-C ubiquitin/RNAse domain-containing protein [Bacteroidales bacterium]
MPKISGAMAINATFRFYEELNDFLKKQYRRHSFTYAFNGVTTVKDAIESMGVPHTEVDLITVNGNPVDFNYRIMEDDTISVYPVYESFDISSVQLLRERVLREPKFILDVHLGKLARYLRMAGFDCLYDKHYDDTEIIQVALSQKRIILTRDKGILKNGKVSRGMFVRSVSPKQQFNEVISRLQLENFIHPFTRCTECNEKIVPVEKEKIIDQLQPLTRKFYSVFYQCSGCKRIYWEGSHFARMKRFMDDSQRRL